MTEEIARSIREIVGVKPFDTFVCTVKSVEGATCTVVRVLDELEISGVRLNCHSTENSGIVVTPKVDSYVLVTSIDGRQHFVSQCSEVEKITINCDTKIIINDGNNGGLINIEKLTQKLKTIETDINSLKNKITAWIPVAQDGGAALKGVVETWAGDLLAITQTSDYEDTKVTH